MEFLSGPVFLAVTQFVFQVDCSSPAGSGNVLSTHYLKNNKGLGIYLIQNNMSKQ